MDLQVLKNSHSYERTPKRRQVRHRLYHYHHHHHNHYHHDHHSRLMTSSSLHPSCGSRARSIEAVYTSLLVPLFTCFSSLLPRNRLGPNFDTHLPLPPSPMPLPSVHRLCGLVDKASASRAEDPELESRLLRDFSGSSHTSDLKIGTPVATLPGAWRYRVSGRPGVSIL